MLFRLSIVGRPNVGKSTLFNRLVGKKSAIVNNLAGVTRDIKEAEAKLNNIKYTVIDTAGLEDAKKDSLQHRMSSLSIKAISSAHACIFVVDSRVGMTGADYTYAALVRRKAKNVILVANKAEGAAAQPGIYEASALGLGHPIAVSAEHGIGIDQLNEKIQDLMNFNNSFGNSLNNKDDISEDDSLIENTLSDTKVLNPKETNIHISVIGRPNSGKSTLINRILGSSRLLTGSEAGITRDSIPVSTRWFGQDFRIVDTAGMRKKAKVQNKLEKLSVADTLKTIRFSEVVVLLFDVNSPFDSQDLKIADLVEREGRAVVIAISKWDLEKNTNKKFDFLRKRVSVLLPQLVGIPLVKLSSLSGYGLANLHKSILSAYQIWNTRINTSKLNQWLFVKLSSHPLPAYKGKKIKMRYITQISSRPPTFVIFTSIVSGVPESFKRYLVNGLRKDFKLDGTPIRVILRSGTNPYHHRKRNKKKL